jgi:hypothetical protein
VVVGVRYLVIGTGSDVELRTFGARLICGEATSRSNAGGRSVPFPETATPSLTPHRLSCGNLLLRNMTALATTEVLSRGVTLAYPDYLRHPHSIRQPSSAAYTNA